MKKLICLLVLMFLFVPHTSFAEWLGWGESGFVLVFRTDNLGNNASSGEDLLQMVKYGDAITVNYGTKCYVIEKRIAAAKVRITSGTYQGYVGWVYIEALRK